MIYKLLLFTSVIAVSFQSNAQQVTGRIKINQVGYYPQAAKVAVVTGNVNAGKFFITSTNLRDTSFTGSLGEQRRSAYSNTNTRMADFSMFTQKGSFVVLIPGVGHSYVFTIHDEMLKETAIATLKGFYFQRISMPLEPEYAGKWHRSAGHPDDTILIHPSAATEKRPAGTVIQSFQGWYR